uniref:Uncharacterized protein n=1 Tax=Setaria viridis TaxID=4556 RepID=A0A4U6T4A8_SETVI|nr:hypothetical protein SEVIR_9G367750v2 [Setaria viridis]
MLHRFNSLWMIWQLCSSTSHATKRIFLVNTSACHSIRKLARAQILPVIYHISNQFQGLEI